MAVHNGEAHLIGYQQYYNANEDFSSFDALTGTSVSYSVYEMPDGERSEGYGVEFDADGNRWDAIERCAYTYNKTDRSMKFSDYRLDILKNGALTYSLKNPDRENNPEEGISYFIYLYLGFMSVWGNDVYVIAECVNWNEQEQSKVEKYVVFKNGEPVWSHDGRILQYVVY